MTPIITNNKEGKKRGRLTTSPQARKNILADHHGKVKAAKEQAEYRERR